MLCEDSNTLRSLLTMRQSYTAPVNFMQVEVIRRVRAAAAAAVAAAAAAPGTPGTHSGELPTAGSGGSATAASAHSAAGASGVLGEGAGIADWQDCLLLTVNGIAAGMRNTG